MPKTRAGVKWKNFGGIRVGAVGLCGLKNFESFIEPQKTQKNFMSFGWRHAKHANPTLFYCFVFFVAGYSTQINRTHPGSLFTRKSIFNFHTRRF